MTTRNTARKTGKILTTPDEKPRISGIRDRCRVLCMGLSNTRIRLGSTVTHPTTPSSTPLAITMPRSRPMVKDMKHRAIKPAMVVTAEPVTEARVASMAAVMASSWPPRRARCSL